MSTTKRKVADLRTAYGEALVKLARKDDRVVVLDADVGHCTGLHEFQHSFPDRFFQMGVAEQNMMSVAAGLASCGLIVFPTCFSAFASRRAHDQVSISVAYTNLNVKIVGSYAGLTSANTGAAHQTVDDIAIMRTMPNMRVIVPADAVEVEQVVFAVAEEEGPCFIRVPKYEAPVIFDGGYEFCLGKAVNVRAGSDVILVSAGIMTSRCIEAAEILESQGISAGVLHVPTIKPIDTQGILQAAASVAAMIVVEDHSVFGGLGSAVAEVVSQVSCCPVHRIGIPDTFGESSEDVELLFRKHGLTAESIAETAGQIIRAKKAPVQTK